MQYFIRDLIVVFILFAGTVLIGQNIIISDKNNPNEPSIMINPKNPAQLIAASNLNNYFISSDTGRTWTIHKQTSSFGVWGDPVISVDTAGHFYYFHLSNPPNGNWIDRIVCQKTTDHGKTWTDGSYTGLNGSKAQDKHWCAIDRTNNIMYLTWTQFDEYGSEDKNKKSNILFSKSIDQGTSWSAPVKINQIDGDCIDSDNTVEGAVPAVGPEGQVYVAWAGPNGLVFNKSNDQGKTWLNKEIKIDPMPTGWDYAIPGIYRANGLPVTVCDLSDGPNKGTIYVNWTDQRNGSDDTDVWLSKSTDEGLSWTSPIRVNDDPEGKQQFFTWMTIDQTTGFLYFVFYDRRNHTDASTDVFMAISKDGGKTFVNRKISDAPFVPNENIFFGDYTNIVAHNNIVRPIWTRLDNAQLSILTDITPLEKIVTVEEFNDENNVGNEISNFPNPSGDLSYVSFKLKKSTVVSLEIKNLNGQVIKKIIDNEIRNYGSYIEPIDLKSLHLPDGTYLINLSLDGKIKTERQVVIK
ncbi:MAG: T9SS type A sorting domain-containing protein [Saprospiraceae bacterium]|nr:T9SS type A sorting domain-containing protein [Saprospiraceae bacterium]MBP6568021.1 T9SS type A sorting domain-containing protein [Saprospiraceae bacterium]